MRRRSFVLCSIVAVLTVFPPFQALAIDRPEAGLWQFTKKHEIKGIIKQSPPKTHCLTEAKIDNFLDGMVKLSPESTIGKSGECKLIDGPKIDEKGVNLRFSCVGKLSSDVTLSYRLEDPRHYTTVFETQVSIGKWPITATLSLEAARIGDCP